MVILKRELTICLTVILALAVTLTAFATGATDVLNVGINGEQASAGVEPPALRCWVSDIAAGTEVRTVRQSTAGAEFEYWLSCSPGATINSLSFYVLFYGSGGWGTSPLVYHIQVFQFRGGYGGITTTPFAVPWWGGNPIIGPAFLVVEINGVIQWANYYQFEITL